MSRPIHSKHGYESPEWVQADARMDKWYKDKKRRADKHGAFNSQKGGGDYAKSAMQKNI